MFRMVLENVALNREVVNDRGNGWRKIQLRDALSRRVGGTR